MSYKLFFTLSSTIFFSPRQNVWLCHKFATLLPKICLIYKILIFLIFIYLRRKMPFLFSFIYIKTHVGEKIKIELRGDLLYFCLQQSKYINIRFFASILFHSSSISQFGYMSRSDKNVILYIF